MTHLRGKSLQCKAGDEHILRRIGTALIVHWDDLPDVLQDRVIDQAILMEDPSPILTTRVDVENFIQTVKTRDFNPVTTV